MSRRLVRGVVPCLVGLFAMLAVVSACDRETEADGDERVVPSEVAAGPARLELTVDPRTGEVPLTVKLHARLAGHSEDEPGSACPSLAWHPGNDDVLLTDTRDCDPEAPPGAFIAEYTYRTAGSFDAFVQLMASDVDPSGYVQVLVTGPTPTPPAIAAVPGPTIIIATPVGSGASAATSVPVSEEQPTDEPPEVAGAATVPVAAPPSADQVAARVLPADLYYVTANDGTLWLLPATGDAPRPVAGVGHPVREYAVSPAGLVAYTTEDDLWLSVPGVEPESYAGPGSSDLLWSRDGRRLAFASDGVWALDVAGYETTQLSTDGVPLSWSPDGEELLILLSDGRIALQTATASHMRTLPVGAVTAAGWMPDREVVWLAGQGLTLLSLGDVPTLVPLVGESSAVSDGFVRPDLNLLALVDDGSAVRAQVVDLNDPTLAVEPVGPRLDMREAAGFAWAPDGRTAVVAGESGLLLLDPSSGASVPLVSDSTRDPHWVLRGR